MLLRWKKIFSVGLLIGLVGFVGCTKDEKKADEAVGPESADKPGEGDESGAALTGGEGTRDPAYTVYFAFDDYTLNMDAQSKVSKLADSLKAGKGVVTIEGHCDERGSTEYNLALGERRAESIKNYLVQLGIAPNRVSTVSYGEEKPVAEGHDEAAWGKNRRGEVVSSGK